METAVERIILAVLTVAATAGGAWLTLKYGA